MEGTIPAAIPAVILMEAITTATAVTVVRIPMGDITIPIRDIPGQILMVGITILGQAIPGQTLTADITTAVMDILLRIPMVVLTTEAVSKARQWRAATPIRQKPGHVKIMSGFFLIHVEAN